MSQCLRCSKPCKATAVFCDDCRFLLKHQLQQKPTHASNAVAVPEQIEVQSVQGDPLERITSPLPGVNASVAPEAVAFPLAAMQGSSEQTISKLSEAAQRIAEEEPGYRRLPRASRLSPLRDISGEIQRESTPLPNVKKGSTAEQRTNEHPRSFKNGDGQANYQSGPDLPDLWPWLDMDGEEKENDTWDTGTDPLQARHLPNSVEVARIEEEDIRRVLAEGVTTAPYPAFRHRRAGTSPWRMALGCLVLLAVIALAVDGILISMALNHSHQATDSQNGPPTLLLSSNVANMGQNLNIHISHFTPLTKVYLTHDIQEGIETSDGSAVVLVGSNGSNDVTIVVGEWGPGFHLIVAEDVSTRYTASATLQIINAGPSRPPHLLIGATSLNLGTDVQGANTIQPLVLHNTGNGSISWSLNSDQPWLQASPTHGIFGSEETISVAVQRINLKPKDYTGTITIFSTIGTPQRVQVEMTVRPLPPNAGAVMSLAPAVLSFTTTDGNANPAQEILTLSNPGSKTLSWSLNNNALAIGPYQAALLQALGAGATWLSTDQTSGSLAPGGTDQIQVMVNSQGLLPGTYNGSLMFTATHGAYDSPQVVSVSLTVQPHCNLLASSGNMTFAAVFGQSNPSNQTMTLNASQSCANATINWQAVSAPSWIVVSPSSGQVRSGISSVTSIGVNISGLAPGPYAGSVSFLTGQSSQTVIVQLTVQPPSPPQAPTISVSPGSLTFSATKGQTNPAEQILTISNSGGSRLTWIDSITTFASTWLTVSKSGGVVEAGGTEQIAVSIDTSTLTPTTWVGQITFSGTDDNGAPVAVSPKILVTVNVSPPCAVNQPSSSTVNFTAVQGSPNPSGTSVTFTASGCGPLNWNATASPGAPWLLFPSGGSLTGSTNSTVTGTIGLNVNATGLASHTYTTQITITVSDTNGMPIQGNIQTFTVNLTVQQPCTLLALPSSLAFTASQGKATTASQQLTISTQGSCSGPISWTVSGDSASSGWLNLSTTSGTGSGTISVSATPGTLGPHVYQGQITVTVSDNGVNIGGSPQTIGITFTVLGYGIGGTATACNGPAPTCLMPQPLAGATVTLLNANNQTVATVTADGSGTFSFSNIAQGSYTIKATGSISGISYNGNAIITVSGDTTGITVQTFAA